jgi:hypothetical protein
MLHSPIDHDRVAIHPWPDDPDDPADDGNAFVEASDAVLTVLIPVGVWSGRLRRLGGRRAALVPAIVLTVLTSAGTSCAPGRPALLVR